MGIISWIVLGLIAGFIASKLVNKRGEGFIGDVILGIVGAVVGGMIAHHLLGMPGMYELNISNILVATGGAVLVLIIYHAVTGRRPIA